jgi:hypothetical protein
MRLVESFFTLARMWKFDGVFNLMLGWIPPPKTVVPAIGPKEAIDPVFSKVYPNIRLGLSPFGRLAKLFEPAGKVRVIAIVDAMTNWLLKPLHVCLFSILRQLPQDGTFNQIKPLVRLIKRNKANFLGSCDMSAATDRLPVILQSAILNALFGKKYPNIGKYWADILVSRPYNTSMFRSVLYATGQPMGALSSWAMLAITHHFLWYWAALSAGVIRRKEWFQDYAVLGDDSCAANKAVVESYLNICKRIGVKVNLAKSLLSPIGAAEFAKRFILPAGDCSPVSIGELLVSYKNFSVMSNWRRKRPNIRLADLLSLYGYKFKTVGGLEKRWVSLPKRVRNMLIVVTSPWGTFPSSTFSEWIMLSGVARSDHAPKLDYPAITLLQEVVKLKDKVNKLRMLNAIQKVPSIFGKNGNSLTKDAWFVDPKTFRMISEVLYEPLRKETFKKGGLLVKDLLVLIDDLSKRAFEAELFEVDEFWTRFLELETRFNNLTLDVSEQRDITAFIPPSSENIVRLYNKFRGPSGFVRPNAAFTPGQIARGEAAYAGFKPGGKLKSTAIIGGYGPLADSVGGPSVKTRNRLMKELKNKGPNFS